MAVARPYVSGLSVRTYWGEIERQEGRFDWSFFDETVRIARDAGKRVFLRVMNGTGTPEWVWQAGAQRYEPRDRSVAHAPVPWDEVFLQKWTAFIAAFGARYDGEAGVDLVAMCMPAGQWAEIFHPRTLPAVPGYSYERFIAAHTRVLDAYAAAFPSTALTLALTGHEKDGTLQRIAGNLVDHLVARFGPHSPLVYLQANGWSEVVHQSHNVMLAHTFDHCWAKPIRRGLQQVAGVQWRFRTPPDHRMGEQSLANAVLLRFGAEFAEIYEVDVVSEADQGPLDQLGALYACGARITPHGWFVAREVDKVRYTMDKSDPATSASADEYAGAAVPPPLERSAYVRYAALVGERMVVAGGYPHFVGASLDTRARRVIVPGAERLRYTVDETSPVAPILGRSHSASAVTISGECLRLDDVPAGRTVRVTPILTREDGKEITGDVYEVLPEHAAGGTRAGVTPLAPLAEPELRLPGEWGSRTGEDL